MSSTKRPPPRFHVGDWVKFDYGPRKVSAKIVEDRGPLGLHGRRIYRVLVPVTDPGMAVNAPTTPFLPETLDAQAATFEVPENELETELAPVRLSYRVKYVRLGPGNVWNATTTREGICKGVKAKGAVAYTTAHWQGEREDDRRYAAVQVLLEVDPLFDEAALDASPQLQRELAEHAEAMADEMFLSRHPRAGSARRRFMIAGRTPDCFTRYRFALFATLPRITRIPRLTCSVAWKNESTSLYAVRRTKLPRCHQSCAPRTKTTHCAGIGGAAGPSGSGTRGNSAAQGYGVAQQANGLAGKTRLSSIVSASHRKAFAA